MNRLALSFLLVLAATSIYAQTPTEATTKDGRVVILNSDGIWEYKRDTPQPPSTSSASPAKQSVELESIPLNFAGIDPKLLSTKLSDLKRRLVKSEFETTAEHEKRFGQEIQKPIVGGLTIRDSFSLVIPNIAASYDADAQKMQFFLPVEKSPIAELSRLANVTQERKTADDLSRINLYSIKWSEDRSYDMQGIYFDKMDGLILTEKDNRQGFLAEVSMGVEEGKRLKNTTKAIVVVRFEEPYVGDGFGRNQLQVRLLNVYFFDSQTGKILARLNRSDKITGAGSSSVESSPVSGGILNGKAISMPDPVYPKEARAAWATGTVTVQVVIDETGAVISASAISGHPLLKPAAVKAAYQARFTPTIISGQPVKVTRVITYNFQL